MPAFGSAPLALNVFEDITKLSGLDAYQGMTHGAAWADFDGDGRPDVYVTNHLNAPRLYRNLGGGRFEDVTARVFKPEHLQGDKHGAAWADFDNDGRPDLVQLTGAIQGMGAEPKRLFHNLGDRFEDVAAAAGVDNLEGRTRSPLWLDLDGDGKLDLFQGAEARLDAKTPPFTFLQRADKRFEAFGAALTPAKRGAPFCILTTLAADDKPVVVCRLMDPKATVQVFDVSSLPARTLDLLPQTAFEDIAAADFDNDGQMDLFMVRKSPPAALALGRPSDNSVVASMALGAAHGEAPLGFTVHGPGPLQVQLGASSTSEPVPVERVHLGAQGTHPAALRFELPASVGALPALAPGAAPGVYIGLTAPDRWDVRVVAGPPPAGKPHAQELQLKLSAAGALTKLEPTGPTAAEEAPARLFMNRSGKFVEESEKRGLNRRLVAGINVVAADFDNDMHVDLFVQASGDVGLQDNLLLLNDGSGKFRIVKEAGGAPGGGGGVGDSVTTADVDGDGFMDILTASGGSMGRSLGLPSDAGRYRLYRNKGNANHWIEIDLEGTRSNRDGIGAVVRVTAGGVTQMRVQGGGMHHRSQNHTRLHFGLARNAQIEKIAVHWPSGAVQELSGPKADQVLKIRETP
ncbi:MAG: CRTAC1 family protein [Betaproteobacteria bacterium]|nr:CRTAC1 family protein [Betaproteobacteria bacterium]